MPPKKKYIIYCFNGQQFEIEAYNQEAAINILNGVYGYSSYDVKAIKEDI